MTLMRARFRRLALRIQLDDNPSRQAHRTWAFPAVSWHFQGSPNRRVCQPPRSLMTYANTRSWTKCPQIKAPSTCLIPHPPRCPKPKRSARNAVHAKARTPKSALPAALCSRNIGNITPGQASTPRPGPHRPGWPDPPRPSPGRRCLPRG